MIRVRTFAWAALAALAACSQPGGGPALPPTGASRTSCYVVKVAPTGVKATITFYGWPDNAPPGNKIAHPVLHDRAGGDGTYCNPTTFATERKNNKRIPYGIKIYVPFLKQYFIREDLCTTSGPPTGSGSNGCYRALVRSVDRRRQELEEARGLRVRAKADARSPSSRHPLAARRNAGAPRRPALSQRAAARRNVRRQTGDRAPDLRASVRCGGYLENARRTTSCGASAATLFRLSKL